MTKKFLVYLGCDQTLIKVENGITEVFPFQAYPVPFPNVTALAVDVYHNLWIGMERGGVAVFNENGVILDAGEPALEPPASLAVRVAPNPFVETCR
jgi:hypothetical protein